MPRSESEELTTELTKAIGEDVRTFFDAQALRAIGMAQQTPCLLVLALPVTGSAKTNRVIGKVIMTSPIMRLVLAETNVEH